MTYDKILIQSEFSERFIEAFNKREKVMLRQGDWGEVEASKVKIGDGYGRPYTITPEAWIVGSLPAISICTGKEIRFDMVAYNADFYDALQDVLGGLCIDEVEPIYFNAAQELLPGYFKA